LFFSNLWKYGKTAGIMAQIVCIANQKGGVGKTTTAVNLSAALAVSEKATLLVDCDPQANATTGIGVDKSDACGDALSRAHRRGPGGLAD
jgi:cellulose biosynthesis protein BcsQ